MATKRSPARRKRGKKLVVLKVGAGLALSTLADSTALMGTLLDVDDSVYLMSADLMVSLRNGTAGEGPIQVGLASSNLSVAQVKEAIIASPTNRGDRIALEQSSRPVRDLGVFPGLATEEVLNNGNHVRAKIKFSLAEPQSLQIYAFNASGSALAGGATVRVAGKVYANWA